MQAASLWRWNIRHTVLSALNTGYMLPMSHGLIPAAGFTKDFDLTAAWLATYLPRSVVSEYMRIDWETVGRCVNRALNDIEPNAPDGWTDL